MISLHILVGKLMSALTLYNISNVQPALAFSFTKSTAVVMSDMVMSDMVIMVVRTSGDL